MTTKNSPKRQDLRFEREAKALQKNLEKRKQQQKKREQPQEASLQTPSNSTKEAHHG